MKIDLLIPSYRAPHPLMLDAINKLLDFSQCKCGIDSLAIAKELCDAHLKGYKPKLSLTSNPFHAPNECPRGKLDIWSPPRVSSCVIQWSRNKLLTMRRVDAEYVLFCDDDIVVEPDYLERLLAHKVDIIAGVCTRRLDPPEPNLRQWLEEIQNYGVLLKWPDDAGLMEVDAVGTGLILLSKRAIEEVALAYHPKLYKECGDGQWFEFGRNPNGTEWGEDVYFCWKAQRIGIPIYVDNTVRPKHVGDYPFGMDDYLAYRDARIEGTTLTEEQRNKRQLFTVGVGVEQ